jgi:hypothetical protein
MVSPHHAPPPQQQTSLKLTIHGFTCAGKFESVGSLIVAFFLISGGFGIGEYPERRLSQAHSSDGKKPRRLLT